MLEPRRVAFLDAPVSGGVVGAEAGTLAIMVGGTEKDFQRARPVFEVMGRPTLSARQEADRLQNCAIS